METSMLVGTRTITGLALNLALRTVANILNHTLHSWLVGAPALWENRNV